MTEPLSILIIDDNQDDRFLYRRALKSGLECRLSEAASGEEGLARLEIESPDCVLLDYNLPGRNGVEILKRIRARHPFLPVIMLTAQGDENIAVTVMREGAQDYLSKSDISPEVLQRMVRVAIELGGLGRRVNEQRASLELFTHALAHDLKEPARTIRSFAALLSEGTLTAEKERQYLRYVGQAAERMGNLVDSVYFYLRLHQSAPPLEACDSQQAFSEAKANLAVLIEESGADVKGEDLPIISGDKTRLAQVFQNLIANAIRYCEENPRVRVAAEKQGETWLFRVSDNGPGIPEEHRKDIFTPFKRLSSRRGDGMGIGLSICQKIIESFGGKIWVEAGPEGGAAFCFALKPAELSCALASSDPVEDKTGAQAALLLVDDSEADVELARYALFEKQKLDCRFSVARNGVEAMANLLPKDGVGEPVDLVVLDINMPGMDGFELLERIRNDVRLKHMPVIMCSTSSYDKDMDQARRLGANGYIVKPLDLEKLRAAVAGLKSVRFGESAGDPTLLRVANL